MPRLTCVLCSHLHSIIFTALISTTAIFVSFTGAALTTPRRAYLFLGGYLSSAISMLLAMRLAGGVLPCAHVVQA